MASYLEKMREDSERLLDASHEHLKQSIKNLLDASGVNYDFEATQPTPSDELDFDNLSIQEMEILRDRIKIEIEASERSVDSTRKFGQKTSDRLRGKKPLFADILEAISGSAFPEEDLLEKKKLLAEIEVRLKRPKSEPKDPIDRVRELGQERDRKLANETDPEIIDFIKQRYRKLIDAEREK